MNVGRPKLTERFYIRRYTSKTKGTRYELIHRDEGYLGVFDSFKEAYDRKEEYDRPIHHRL